jgi:hypothetical protein
MLLLGSLLTAFVLVGRRCSSLKLAMVKNARIAKKLFNGNLYDCICLYEPGTVAAADGRAVQSGTPAAVSSSPP